MALLPDDVRVHEAALKNAGAHAAPVQLLTRLLRQLPVVRVFHEAIAFALPCSNIYSLDLEKLKVCFTICIISMILIIKKVFRDWKKYRCVLYFEPKKIVEYQ